MGNFPSCCVDCFHSRRSQTYEPLLLENEREAVADLLQYLENRTTTNFFTGSPLSALTTLSFSDNVDLQRSAALAFAEITEKEVRPVGRDTVDPILFSKRKRATPEIIEREVIVEIDASNPEAGWDDDTSPTAVVLDYHTAANVTRRVAFTAKMFDPKPAKVSGPDDAWSFEKIFGDGDFMAAGQLVIPVGKRKPGKGTKDNTYIFYVVEGAVNVFIADTQVVLATGGMFMVPRGNSYFIENIAERPAKLFFTQARKVREDELEEEGGARGISVAMGGEGRGGSSMGEREGRSGSAGSKRLPSLEDRGSLHSCLVDNLNLYGCRSGWNPGQLEKISGHLNTVVRQHASRLQSLHRTSPASESHRREHRGQSSCLRLSSFFLRAVIDTQSA
ncbi:Mif2/CENP-C like-domain-containing protein [Mycena alexandri]|uniref:CENP-C homolog n=1 Tax=Mycena alexandri TaxID=1745969 RepID=A0AAD6WUZ7_9AGAR|nr:Mif2/CENP-C like-domain-containing protein [Mycena alexandri]